MKTKEFKELRSKGLKDLMKLAHTKRQEILKKSMEVMGGREKNLKLVANLRNELAKILTLVREKEIIEKLTVKNEEGKTK